MTALYPPASASTPTLVLVGARSNAGRAIARLWPADRLVAIHRDSADPRGIGVPDYLAVAEHALEPGCVVVNCVGTPHGTAGVLLRINRDVALAWAEAAQRRGAAGFVNLSSFSVYGRNECIGPATPAQPDGAYGASKLAADEGLAARETAAMPIARLRIPMLFGDGPDKLAQIVGLTTRLRMVPRLPHPIARAMLGYGALARAIAYLAAAPQGGVFHHADRQEFGYDLLAARIAAVRGVRVSRVPVSRIAERLAALAVPGLHARLLASSRVDPALLLDCPVSPDEGLIAALDALIAQGAYRAAGNTIAR